MRLVDATTAATVWKARHEKARSYMFYKPNLKDVAAELTDEMIKYMPPQAKQSPDKSLVHLVYLVCLVYSVGLVCLVERN